MTTIMLQGDFPLVKWMREKAQNGELSLNGFKNKFLNLFWFRKNSKEEIVQDKEKFLSALFSCPMCMGFWCGLFVSIIVYGLSWTILPLAFAGSFASRLNAFVETWLEANSLVNIDEK